MGLEEFVNEYFVRPIVEYSGYNIVNTLIYAVIALAAAYALFLVLRKRFTKEFILYLVPFIFLGSTIRVMADSIYMGVAQQHMGEMLGFVGFVVNSHIYDYGFWTVTPGIYLVTAAIVLISIVASELLKRPKLLPAIGIVLLIPHFLFLVPMFRNYMFIVILLAIAAISALVAMLVLNRWKIGSLQSKIAVFAHSLDGSATLTAITIFNSLSDECLVNGLCYREEHVVGGLMAGFGYGLVVFLLIKVAFSLIACHIIEGSSKMRIQGISCIS